ncbi:hypothetical protein [Pseudomonas sp. SCB32]|uniref:hypothetical protein n=1 Tax=Pseudomonas sp. SCB32 TaxID=2653853 RepID=UPI001264F171|nr:hypothetical protein [Pseudomonas sp. SCB32]
MPIALRSTTLLAMLFSSQLMAAGAVVQFGGAVVEDGCQVQLRDATASSAQVKVRQCSQAMLLQLNEPRSALPSKHYQLTDTKGRALGPAVTATGGTDSVIRTMTTGAAGTERNVVLVAEYL